MKPSGRVQRRRAVQRRDFSRASRTGGFSLIELFIVLAILLILTTMYWGFAGRNHQREQQKICRVQLQKIFIALQIYANEHTGKFPVVTNAVTSEAPLNLLVPRYTSDTATFVCPGSKDSALPAGEPLTKGRISYAYFMGRQSAGEPAPLMSDKLVDTQCKAVGENVFSTDGKAPGNNHHKYGGNFLFGDGRTEFSPPRLAFTLSTQGVVVLNPKP